MEQTPELIYLNTCDYIIQGALLLLALLLPWSLRYKYGLHGFFPRLFMAFAVPFFFGTARAFWRMIYFDDITNNDVPGMFYIVDAFILGVLSSATFSVRCIVLEHLAIWRLRRTGTPTSDGTPGVRK